jgi:hypothetical protein
MSTFKCETSSHRINRFVHEPIETGGDVEHGSSGRKYLCRFSLLFPVIILGLAGCGGGLQNQDGTGPLSVQVSVSVNPSSATVAAGSTAFFKAVFTPSRPNAGSLTWSVTPPQGGTITTAGEYTASATAGTYLVVATWTPSNPAAGTSISGSAVVEVLPPPQLGAELNTDLTQASGAIQVFGQIQNAAIVGQLVPSVISVDPSDRVRVRSGFTIPVECIGPNKSCP